MKVLRLRDESNYLEEYIVLRNHLKKFLLANSVNLEETKDWLNYFDVEVIIAIENKKLLGACILHIYRDGEVSIFTRTSRNGIGTILLNEIEKYAIQRKFKSIWAWISDTNIASQNFFKKNEFVKKRKKIKIYSDEKIKGSIYIKNLK